MNILELYEPINECLHGMEVSFACARRARSEKFCPFFCATLLLGQKISSKQSRKRKETMNKIPEQQTLLTGLVLGESPRWHDDRLWFSDWGAHEVIAVDLEGKSEVIATSRPFHFASTGYPRVACLSSRGAIDCSCAGSQTGRW